MSIISDTTPREFYEAYHAECMKRDLSNSENLDKSVLTYSSAGFALSLGFLKDFVPISKAAVPFALYGSWIFFNLAIVLTIASLIMSQLGLRRQLALAHEYYIERNAAAFDQKNGWQNAVTNTNYAAGFSFVLAVMLTTMFVSFNLEKAGIMTEKTHRTQDGAMVPSMQRVPSTLERRGATIPPMQQIPVTQQESPPPPPPDQSK